MSVACAPGNASLLNAGSLPCHNLASNFTAVCEEIASQLSAPESVVYWPGSSEYSFATEHWSLASSLPAACSVVPTTPEDVGAILRIVKATGTPFGVKGGGHNTLPGASGTSGVHIAMHGFKEVTYHEDDQTAYVGSGNLWDEVYSGLQKFNRTAVGGRSVGVGVGGLSLIGGFSWLSNEHGLALDNIVGYQVVLPDGEVAEVTGESDPDLFWALKGGGHNFGVVTRFTMKTYEQGPVWGGIITYPATELDAYIDAIMAFEAQKDTKAGVIAAIHVDSSEDGMHLLHAILYYNAPNAPEGIFERFFDIPALANSVDGPRSFVNFLETYALPNPSGQRMFAENTNTAGYTPKLIRHIYDEALTAVRKLGPHSVTGIDASVFPLMDKGFKSNALPSAWPPHRDIYFRPAYVEAQFNDAAADAVVRAELQRVRKSILDVAIEEGQYPREQGKRYEYLCSAGPAVQLEEIYGPSVGRLREVKGRVDPENVMGLAGGHKIQLV